MANYAILCTGTVRHSAARQLQRFLCVRKADLKGNVTEMSHGSKPAPSTISPASFREILQTELARRISAMPLKDLLQELADEAPRGPERKTERRPSTTPDGSEHTIKLQTALIEVMRAAERPLSVVEIIDRVRVIRPGSLESSIRSEVSKARKAGFVKLVSPTVRNGEYIVGKSEIALRRTG